jgi:VWFA-related protein
MPNAECRMPISKAVFVLVAIAAHAALSAQEPQRPVIRSGVELLVVDVQVVDRQGQPILTLGPSDFEVTLDRKARRVTSAQLVRHGAANIPAAGAPIGPATPPPSAAAPVTAADGRRFILAVDEHSFRPAAARAVMHAANRFIDQLQPNDLVGLYAYPTGAVHSDLTNDHAAVRRMVDKVTGLLDLPLTRYNLSKSEAVDIASQDGQTLARVAQRECRKDLFCIKEIQMEAQVLAVAFEMQVSQSTAGLRDLFEGLKKLEGRKTLVIVSGGLFTSDRANGRAQMRTMIQTVGRQAAASNTNLYVLHMDSSFLDEFSASKRGGPSHTLFRDSSQLATGLEVLADTGGGALIRVQAGTGDAAFQRVLRENSAYYLLGVEPDAADRDGESHQIQVKVRGRDLTVRSRKQVVVPR